MRARQGSRKPEPVHAPRVLPVRIPFRCGAPGKPGCKAAEALPAYDSRDWRRTGSPEVTLPAFCARSRGAGFHDERDTSEPPSSLLGWLPSAPVQGAWWGRRDSNPQPPVSETGALTICATSPRDRFDAVRGTRAADLLTGAACAAGRYRGDPSSCAARSRAALVSKTKNPGDFGSPGSRLFRGGIGVYPGDPREARSKPMVGLSSFGEPTTAIVLVPCTEFDSVCGCRGATRPRYDERPSPRSHRGSSCISLRQSTGENSASSNLNFACRRDTRRARVREYANA